MKVCVAAGDHDRAPEGILRVDFRVVPSFA